MTLASLIKNIKWRFARLFYSENAYKWFQARERNENFKEGKIVSIDEYTDDKPINKCNKRVVCIYDGKIKNGGLADRLRGIISVYEVCKEQNIDFKLIFKSPFNLVDFLQPNKINWNIGKEHLNFNTKFVNICCIDTFDGSDYEARKQRRWFEKAFKKDYMEFHVRTNAFFAYNGNFSSLFNELFKLSPRLQTSINKLKSELGNSYISTSFRFLNLLDDFNETCGRDYQLTPKEQEKLINGNIEQLQQLHNKYPGKRILVNSDSTTFLNRVKELDYVFAISGNITHIDGKNDNNEYKTYEKTFLDFFMIANAEKIYLLRTGGMYNSGYPYAASKIYNRPFEKIEF